MKLKHLLVVGMLVAAVPAAAGIAFAGNGNERSATATGAAVRATAAFHDVNVAVDAGYGEFRDAAQIACIQHPTLGTMGIHYVKGSLLDAVIDATQPEALVYEPEANGNLKLVALEYIVFQSVWEGAGNTEPPSLFGQAFDFTSADNRYGIPAFYSLHAWIWKPNSAGLLTPWNPSAHC